MQNKLTDCGGACFPAFPSLYSALPGLLLPWYAANARTLPWREDHEPYRVWVSEIMLQQTRVEAVRGYFTRFIEAFPTVEVLAAAEESRVLKLWEGLGYYSRARNLQKAARVIISEYGGKFPETAEELKKLPGVGEYTAGAVASICFGQPAAAVDGNVLRIIARMTAEPRAVDLPIVKREIAEQLEAVYPMGRAGDFTQALMELGACVCTPKNPSCGNCPAKEICRAREQGKAEKFPVRLPKTKKKEEERTVFLLRCGGKFAIERRGESGLLGGLWQFPNVSGTLTPEEAVKTAAEFGVEPRDIVRESHRDHIFTHIRWEMAAYLLECAAAPEKFTWASREELAEKFVLPTAFRQFLADL